MNLVEPDLDQAFLVRCGHNRRRGLVAEVLLGQLETAGDAGAIVDIDLGSVCDRAGPWISAFAAASAGLRLMA